MILYYDFEDVVLEAETEGGCIESLTDGVKNILYPRTTINIDGKEKKRGGSHPCVPGRYEQGCQLLYSFIGRDRGVQGFKDAFVL